ncbi:nuclear transcription factor Y subunit C-10 [Capsella rubella]|uniref:nuclear transcription factor Y subunit C-10 n=1 Tax=Capsella rubella TaxID=81985 RepID=UPI000CD4DA85|nr:nuclear transcription factor Y subunit C-10 [Capsella rubella]
MVKPVIVTSSLIPNPSMQETCSMNEHREPSTRSLTQSSDQRRPFYPAHREYNDPCNFIFDEQRDLLNQDLEMFWAHQNSSELHKKPDLPLATVKRVMKCDPNVKMVSWKGPVLLAKASEMFIQEVTLRAWRQTQSRSRTTIRSCDIHAALRSSVIYNELVNLLSPQGTTHQQMLPPENVNEPNMKVPIDIDQIQQQSLFNLKADHFIEIGEFELDPMIQ